MNKNKWAIEAKQYIDSLSSEEFEDFLVSCDPFQVSITDYSISDITIGRTINLSGFVASEAANLDDFHCFDDFEGNIAA